MDRLIDLTRLIEDAMPIYPGDDETELYQSKKLEIDGYNNHTLKINMHAGTHIDIPMHLIHSRKYISDIPLDTFIGNGCVLDVRGEKVIKLKQEYELKIKENDIVFFYTGLDIKFGSNEYFNEHPVIDTDLAEFLIQKGIKILGIDTPSPDKYPFDIHKVLLRNNILIIENLNNLNELLGMEKFEIIAFPLKIKADASIIRVVARIL